MKRHAVFAIALLSATALGGTASFAIEAKKLTYASYLTDTYTLVKVDNWFMDQVTERTGGAITFERYYGGTMLQASDVLPGVAAGAADMGMSVPSAYNRADYPLSNVTLPFISEHVDSVTKAFRDLYDQNEPFRTEYQSKGLQLLYAPAYSENTIWSNKPIQKPEDISGLRVRAVLAVGDVLDGLGASVVSIAWPEALEGMQRGVVDAMSAAPFDTSVTGGLAEIAPNGSDMGRLGVYAVSATVLNLNTWNALEPEAQKVFQEVAAEVPEYYLSLLNKTIDESAAKVADRVKSGALKIDRFSDEDAVKMRETAAKSVEAAWLEKAKAAGVDGAAVLAKYKELTAKYDAETGYEPGFDRVEKLTR